MQSEYKTAFIEIALNMSRSSIMPSETLYD
jgi:hypothetical protein